MKVVGASVPITTHPGRLLGVLALGGAAYALLQSLVVPALPTLQEDLHTSPTGVTWIFTAYLLARLGRDADRRPPRRHVRQEAHARDRARRASPSARSSRRSSSTLALMIAARVIQGLGGAIFPLAFGIIRDEFPPRARRRRDRR